MGPEMTFKATREFIDAKTAQMIMESVNNPLNHYDDGGLMVDGIHADCDDYLLNALKSCGMDKTVEAYRKVKREVGFYYI